MRSSQFSNTYKQTFKQITHPQIVNTKGASDSNLKEKNSKNVLETWGTLLVVVLVNHIAKSGHPAHERNATDRLSCWAYRSQ